MTQEEFLADLQTAVANDATHVGALTVVRAAFADLPNVRKIVGEPVAGGIFPLHVSDTLTVLNVVWKPHMQLLPHNHNMWAIIGVYAGREDNTYWKRATNDAEGRIAKAGIQSLETGDVIPLGVNVIHSVTNPLDTHTGALHVYGGNFFEQPRSEWPLDTLIEQPFNSSRVQSFAN